MNSTRHPPDDLRRRLRQAMDRHGLKPAEWARRAGVDSGTLYKFFKGVNDSVTHRTLEKLADAVGESVPAITGAVQAGGGNHEGAGLAENDTAAPPAGRDGYMRAVAAVLQPGLRRPAVLRITNDAIGLAGFVPGDHVIIDTERSAAQGDIVIAQIYDDDAGAAETVIRELRDGYLVPRSLGGAYPVYPAGGEHTRIVGVVVDKFRGIPDGPDTGLAEFDDPFRIPG